MQALPVGWTDEIVAALPEWLRAEFGLGPDPAPVPPPNLPGYAPLPGYGGGYQAPAEPAANAAAAATTPNPWGMIGLGVLLGGVAALVIVESQR